ncbi:MAG: hypothetical protein ACJ703_09670, partial [Nitrososphaera sp.]
IILLLKLRQTCHTTNNIFEAFSTQVDKFRPHLGPAVTTTTASIYAAPDVGSKQLQYQLQSGHTINCRKNCSSVLHHTDD